MTRVKLKNILLRTAFVLLGTTVFAVGSFSLARYVSSEEAKSSAGVAGLGVKVFELTDGSQRAEIDYTQVVPGFDIPVPRLSLHLDSEVSYTLYLKVTESSDVGGVHKWTDPEFKLGNAIMGYDSAGNPCEVVEYMLAPWWIYEGATVHTEQGVSYRVKYYSYNLAVDTDHGGSDAPDVKPNQKFKAGEVYNYTNVNGAAPTIGLLEGDAIWISQYYGVHDNTPPRFTLAFEAYIRQTLR